VAALARFLDYVESHPHAWVATRLDIARHWIKHHPPAGGYRPSRMSKALFVEVFGDIFEHTPQIAARAHEAGMTDAQDNAQGLHEALVAQMRVMNADEKRALICAHPDLAGRLALAKQLTDDSAKEQGSAGLDKLSADELARFTALNETYKTRFGFPFIMAVKGATKDQILAGFERRIAHDETAEFNEALAQIEKIALLRLTDRLPS
jgi:OHCU decarboxylase